jgi:glutathione S-transferase
LAANNRRSCGQALVPTTLQARTDCEQWSSAIKDYYYDAMVRRYTLQYVFPRGADNKPDRAVIDGAVKDMKLQLEALDRAYAQSDYLAGGQLSIADLLIAPILAYVENRPEGAQLMANAPNVRRAQKTIRARASFTETQT